MLNLSTNQVVHTIAMPTGKEYMVIASKKHSAVEREVIIMTPLSEKDYHIIKRGENIALVRAEQTFVVTADDIYCFGKIDFHEGSDDCKELNTFKWLDDLFVKGVCIPARYNYDNHECTSPIKQYLYTETFNNDTLCRYLHGCLGKPEYTLIFREIV